MTYYVSTLLVYFGVDILAVWGLNVQYGLCGIYNFAFILFQSVGAYMAAVLTLGSASGNGGYQHYILGASLPFPLPIIAAGVAGGLLGLVLGLVTRRVGNDYLAVLTFVVSVMALLVVSAVIPIFNGDAGLSSVPPPLQTSLNLSFAAYPWFYVVFVGLVCVLAYLSIRALTNSPLGRQMRAIRDNEHASSSLGKNVAGVRLFALAYGGVLAGVSGALLVLFIGTWSPGSWEYAETLVAFSAIIIGGTGNNWGVVVGVFVIQILLAELPRFLPSFSAANLVGSMQWIVIGTLTLGFMWWRPHGIFPERRNIDDLGAEIETEGRPGRVLSWLNGLGAGKERAS
jgi:ABC-type branched-subunit amino acid transport system permease subunit